MYTQQDLDQVLDNIHQGPIGQKKQFQWDMSNTRMGRPVKRTRKGINNIVKTRNSERVITDQQVLEIKEKYNNNHLPIDLAKEYGVKRPFINMILNNKGRFDNEELYGPPVVRKSARKRLIREITTDTVGGLIELSKKFNCTSGNILHHLNKSSSTRNGFRFEEL